MTVAKNCIVIKTNNRIIIIINSNYNNNKFNLNRSLKGIKNNKTNKIQFRNCNNTNRIYIRNKKISNQSNKILIRYSILNTFNKNNNKIYCLI